jgi:hypothetical protein
MKDQIKALLAKHNLTVESVFIPFSQSRNKHEKMPSLNWKVTLKHNGRDVLTTDYMAGCAHAPSYEQMKTGILYNRIIMAECEKGCKARYSDTLQMVITPKQNHGTLKPDAADVIYSLLIDSEVLDYPTFEEWAGEFGYDPDSRKGEQIYNDCMKIALQMRRLGESLLAELRDAFQDY